MPVCAICTRKKKGIDTFEDQEHNTLIESGMDCDCQGEGCGTKVFVCYTCYHHDLGQILCPNHDLCQFAPPSQPQKKQKKKSSNTKDEQEDDEPCEEPATTTNFCNKCYVIVRLCDEHRQTLRSNVGSRRSYKCGCEEGRDKKVLDNLPLLHEVLEKQEIPVIEYMPATVPVASCSDLSQDYVDVAKKYADTLATWVEQNMESKSVSSQTTVAVTFLSRGAGEGLEGGRPTKVKILITHSQYNTYRQETAKKDQLRAKFPEDTKERKRDTDSGMRQLAALFMKVNKPVFEQFRKEAKIEDVPLTILLPQSDPLVWCERNSGTSTELTGRRWLLVPDKGGKGEAQKNEIDDLDPTPVNVSLQAAASYASKCGMKVQTVKNEDDEDVLMLYDYDGDHQHHAEMRALKYADTHGYGVMAIAPTKGCCDKCNPALGGLGLLKCVPDKRQTQKGYNDHKSNKN